VELLRGPACPSSAPRRLSATSDHDVEIAQTKDEQRLIAGNAGDVPYANDMLEITQHGREQETKEDSQAARELLLRAIRTKE
jgi:hypothetical protein